MLCNAMLYYAGTHLFVQLKALPLTLNICLIQIIAAHLILILHEELPICHVSGVLNVLEMWDTLPSAHYLSHAHSLA